MIVKNVKNWGEKVLQTTAWIIKVAAEQQVDQTVGQTVDLVVDLVEENKHVILRSKIITMQSVH